MRIHIATDHAGFDLKNAMIAHFAELGHEIVDHGAHVYEKLDAYPTMCTECAKAVAQDQGSLGIVLGGSGNGEQIAANKVPGIRAALVWNESTAKLAREHNNANICAIGARQHTESEAIALAQAFIDEPFSNDPRHIERIDMISRFEESGSCL